VRFLHTADWHVGKTLRNRSRMDEFAAALDEVAGLAVAREVDAVLVAGDIFDSPAPPPEAERLVYDFLARLLPEHIACVLIAGNHDHPRKLAALSRLLEGLRIYVRAEVRPPEQGGVVSLPSRDGSETARVAVLPFVPERKVVDASLVLGPEEERYKTYASRIERILRALTRGLGPDTVNVVLGHLLLEGGRVGTGVRALHLGQAYGLQAEQLPEGVQYVGLGHLHRPQEVMAPAPTAYPGSLLELDFGETEQDKSVVLVEARPGRAARLEWVRLSAGRRLRTLEGPLEEVLRAGAEAKDDHLQVRVRVEGPTPGVAEQVREALPNAVDVSLAYERKVWEAAEATGTRLPPADQFAAFYRRKHGAEPPPDLIRLFARAYEEAAGVPEAVGVA
jgi:exonuclease SbcD